MFGVLIAASLIFAGLSMIFGVWPVALIAVGVIALVLYWKSDKL